ncbi:uncharacterized protein LOC121387119 [Gigantopelta aegis]|uniref:uncharacterized protein LOC121387119 n=1 Tax=Gigantopelta aegis TaxID=1735272 RepID=UPI001B88A411|nr:uncharacterized protein LOC121387119 [Gigantopelta aegis]
MSKCWSCLLLVASWICFKTHSVSGACESGQYGLDCSYTCHCDAANCNGVTGCSGNCQKGWFGPKCTTENVALRKTTYQSSYVPNYTHVAVLAVDGDHRTTGGFCMVTGVNLPYTWWEVDLERDYYIHKLAIYFRTDFKDRRNGVQIYSSTEVNQTNAGHLCGATTINSRDVTTITCDSTAKYITLYREQTNNDGKSTIDFCEVEVYSEYTIHTFVFYVRLMRHVR